MMINRNETTTITLKDGRTLAYAEYGDVSGVPIFYFHGGGLGSRLMAQNLEIEAVNLGARIIAPDRPGIGLSDFKPGRLIGDWPQVLQELVHVLGIERFAIISESGGNSYAAACAAQIPECLAAVAIVSGFNSYVSGVTESISIFDRIVNWPAGRVPFSVLKLIVAQVAHTLRREPGEFLAQLIKDTPDLDPLVSDSPGCRQMALECFWKAFCQGICDPAWDLRFYPQSWGIALKSIPIEIQIWHGELEHNISPAMAHHMVFTVPKYLAILHPEDGHLSALYNHALEILGGVLAAF